MTLEEESTQALECTIEAGKARGYYPTYFMQMLAQHGGVETAKRLLAKRGEPQTGLDRLWELNLLDDSLEAVVLREKFRVLFTDAQLQEARRRLEELGYFK